MREITIILHDIRSTHNVGSLLRTADCFGAKVIITGYTPYPSLGNDTRLPHIARRQTAQIHKTALGAEADLSLWSQANDIDQVLHKLKQDNYEIIALEQSPNAQPLHSFSPPNKLALLIGREVEGIEKNLINICDEIVEIHQFGKKESLNVVQAATTAVYHCRFYPF